MLWTDEEKQLLIENYSSMTNKELCELLNKTEGQIRGLKERLRLNSKSNPFTNEEKEIIINYYKSHKDNLNLDELSNLIHRQKTSISRFARKVGLTDNGRPMTDESIKKLKNSLKIYRETDKYKNDTYLRQKELLNYYANNIHPKGMLGKHHSEETKKQMSKSHIELAASMTYDEKHEIAMKALKTKKKKGTTNNTTSNAYSRTKGGKRKDLNNQYFRSSWEANIARILNYEDIEWNYECQRFYFEDESDHVLSYQPDFYLPQFHKWIEVKGWMDEKSKIRLEKFKKEYPEENENLIIIDKEFYNSLSDEFKYVVWYWEDGSKKVKKLAS